MSACFYDAYLLLANPASFAPPSQIYQGISTIIVYVLYI